MFKFVHRKHKGIAKDGGGRRNYLRIGRFLTVYGEKLLEVVGSDGCMAVCKCLTPLSYTLKMILSVRCVSVST